MLFTFIRLYIIIRDRRRDYTDFAIFYNINVEEKNYIILKPLHSLSFYKIITLTISSPCNYFRRNIIRQYISKFQIYAYHIFVIGKCNCKKLIYQESRIHKDILFINYYNHYFNITPILLIALNWINNKFHYNYLIKWDDDIILNIPLLLLYINNHIEALNYCGFFYNKTGICRNRNRICYIPFRLYKYIYIPSFVASGILILSLSISRSINLYRNIYKRYMIRDDQYIGVICKILSIKPVALNNYYFRSCRTTNITKIKQLIAYHTFHYSDLYLIYKLIQRE